MIQTKTQVPSTYYLRSRDFQLLGRIFDTVFNSSKTFSDLIQYDVISKNTDKKLLDLITKTLGFDAKRTYDINDLYTLCNVFKLILREKGTKKSIEDCVRVLLKAQNINKSFTVSINNSTYQVDINIPKEMTDVALLEDMLDYVLPIGYTYSIIVSSGQVALSEVEANVQINIPTHTAYLDSELGWVYGYRENVSDTDITHYEIENATVYSSNNGDD